MKEITTSPAELMFMVVGSNGFPYLSRRNEWDDPEIFRGFQTEPVVELSPECAELAQQWLLTSVYRDGTISGIWADWIEENMGEFPRKQLLLEFLRERFHDPKRNE